MRDVPRNSAFLPGKLGIANWPCVAHVLSAVLRAGG